MRKAVNLKLITSRRCPLDSSPNLVQCSILTKHALFVFSIQPNAFKLRQSSFPSFPKQNSGAFFFLLIFSGIQSQLWLNAVFICCRLSLQLAFSRLQKIWARLIPNLLNLYRLHLPCLERRVNRGNTGLEIAAAVMWEVAAAVMWDFVTRRKIFTNVYFVVVVL